MRPQKLTRCALFVAFIALGAFIQIPMPYGDYFTLQFLFVILAGLILGSRTGALAVCLYIALGLVGVPVFAAGGGLSYLLRPSFGYLVGFVAAAALAGCARKSDRPLVFFLLALVACYTIGLGYKYILLRFLYTPLPFNVLLLSVFPLDLPGDFLACLLCAALKPRLLAYIPQSS